MSLLVHHILRIYYETKSTSSNDHCSVLVFIFSLSSVTIIVQATVLQLHLGNDCFKTEQESRTFFFLSLFQICFLFHLFFMKSIAVSENCPCKNNLFTLVWRTDNRNLSGIQTEPLGYIIIIKPATVSGIQTAKLTDVLINFQ